MVANLPGPYEIRLLYETTVLGTPFQHTAHYSVDVDGAPAPGTAASLINIKLRNGGTNNMVNIMTDWVNAIRPMYTTDVQFVAAELWKFTPGTLDATFISTHTVGLSGQATGVPVPASEIIVTSRTQLGGLVRCHFMHAFALPSVPDAYPFAGIFATLSAALASPAQWILGRDNSFLLQPLRLLPGTNEKLFRKLYR